MKTLQVDVAVLGGGTAGCFAAIAAAKSGASVLLIEKASMLGGTMTTAGVAFPGLFHAWGRQIIDGLCWQSILRAAELGGAQLPSISYQPQYHWQEQVHVNRFTYAAVLDEMCRQAGCHVLLHTMLYDAVEQDSGIKLQLAAKEGPVTVSASFAIDCSGDASLVSRLGYPMQDSADTQPATLIHDLAGYQPSQLDKNAFCTFLQQAIDRGDLLPQDSQGFSLWDQISGQRINMHIAAPDAQTSAGRTALEQNARATLLRIVTVLRKFPGLEGLYVSSFAEECGVRETRRIVGEVCMQVDDYVNGYRYPDAVCYAFYPVDRHQPTGIHQIFLKPEVVPTVSYGALVPKGSKRLLVAGRCVSCDRDTLSAIRVAAPCMAMGQAAGTAAALAVQTGCAAAQVPYQQLCNNLRKLGAIIPGE